MKDNKFTSSGCPYLLLFTCRNFKVFHMLCFKWYQTYNLKSSLKKYTCKAEYFQLSIKVQDFTEETNQTINIIKGKLKTKTYDES